MCILLNGIQCAFWGINSSFLMFIEQFMGRCTIISCNAWLKCFGVSSFKNYLYYQTDFLIKTQGYLSMCSRLLCRSVFKKAMASLSVSPGCASRVVACCVVFELLVIIDVRRWILSLIRFFDSSFDLSLVLVLSFVGSLVSALFVGRSLVRLIFESRSGTYMSAPSVELTKYLRRIKVNRTS